MKTTLSPASTPFATSIVDKAATTSLPRPSAPAIPAMTAMDRASMMTWLTPVMMVGMACGSWMPRRIWLGVAPNAWPASTVSASTPRMPSSVSRTPGGKEKMTVAMTPGTNPMLKNTMTGMRYTSAGIVCMKSITGLTMALTVSLRAAQMPTGMAMTIVTSVAIRTSASVCIAVSH